MKLERSIYLVGHDATMKFTFGAGHTIVHKSDTFTLMRPQNVANNWIDDNVNQHFRFVLQQFAVFRLL